MTVGLDLLGCLFLNPKTKKANWPFLSIVLHSSAYLSATACHQLGLMAWFYYLGLGRGVFAWQLGFPIF